MGSKDLGQTAIQGLMELTCGRVLGLVTEWLRFRLCDKQMNMKDISLESIVSLATLRSMRLPEVVDAALVKADWISLP